jgi:DNA-binding NarL/FixJ family response regulator
MLGMPSRSDAQAHVDASAEQVLPSTETLFPQGLLQEVAAGRIRLRLSYRSGEDLIIMSAKEVAELDARASGVPEGEAKGSPLTGRETDILRLIAGGNGGSAVALELGLALNTVNQHLIAARRKLQVTSSKEAARLAQENGWLRAVASD